MDRREASKAAKPIRRHRPAVSNTKLPSLSTSKVLNTSRHKNKNTTEIKKYEHINPTQQVPKKRNKRFANVRSSGYGSTYKPNSPSAEVSSNSTGDKARPTPRHGRVHTKTRLPPIQR